MKKKWVIIGVIVLVVLLIGINIWKQNSTTNLEVETATLKEETMSETVMTPGTLTLEEEQYIYFQAEKGEIDEILVAEGRSEERRVGKECKEMWEQKRARKQNKT